MAEACVTSFRFLNSEVPQWKTCGVVQNVNHRRNSVFMYMRYLMNPLSTSQFFLFLTVAMLWMVIMFFPRMSQNWHVHLLKVEPLELLWKLRPSINGRYSRMSNLKRLCGVLCTNGNARVFLLVFESSYV